MPNVDVHHLGRYSFTQSLIAGAHAFYADEPEEDDGDDLGPTPYELLLWALGACTSMTLMMYARRKGWPLQDVTVHLHHDRVHALDSAAAEQTGGRMERIERELTLIGDLSEEQRARLLEIAARCPVHRTLTGDVTVVDRLAEQPHPLEHGDG